MPQWMVAIVAALVLGASSTVEAKWTQHVWQGSLCTDCDDFGCYPDCDPGSTVIGTLTLTTRADRTASALTTVGSFDAWGAAASPSTGA